MSADDCAPRLILGCLALAALLALVGLCATAGIAGFGFGFALLMCGAVGAGCIEEIGQENDEAAS